MSTPIEQLVARLEVIVSIQPNEDDPSCAVCHELMSTDNECEPTAMCHHCAQKIVADQLPRLLANWRAKETLIQSLLNER